MDYETTPDIYITNYFKLVTTFLTIIFVAKIKSVLIFWIVEGGGGGGGLFCFAFFKVTSLGIVFLVLVLWY
jgi:hypothetical protein